MRKGIAYTAKYELDKEGIPIEKEYLFDDGCKVITEDTNRNGLADKVSLSGKCQ
jgi:hypothetical protein